jgi:hypothetical protein
MTSVAVFLTVATLLAPMPLDSSQSPVALPQAWGLSTRGLRMGISVASADSSPTAAEFSVAIENTSDSDFVLNLGFMLANGKVVLPTAVHLLLTDPAGTTRELAFSTPPVAGRVDDFTVALRRGSIYTLHVALSQYWSPATNGFGLKLPLGRSRIAARFEGHGAQFQNSDVALLNFWKGTVESNVVEVDVPAPGTLRRVP